MVLGKSRLHQPHGACIVIPSPASSRPALEAVHASAAVLVRLPTMFIAELGLPTLPATTCPACGPDHGRLALPVEVMKRVVSEMHMTEVTICYGMTKPRRSPPRRGRRRHRPAGLDRGTVHPHVESRS